MVFRILTAKSIIGIGRYKTSRVSHLLANKQYLQIASLYYSLSHVSFHEDVLNEVGITEKWRIEKPGTDKDKLFNFGNQVLPDQVRKAKVDSDKRGIKRSQNTLMMEKRINNNKTFLMNSNRGKKPGYC